MPADDPHHHATAAERAAHPIRLIRHLWLGMTLLALGIAVAIIRCAFIAADRNGDPEVGRVVATVYLGLVIVGAVSMMVGENRRRSSAEAAELGELMLMLRDDVARLRVDLVRRLEALEKKVEQEGAQTRREFAARLDALEKRIDGAHMGALVGQDMAEMNAKVDLLRRDHDELSEEVCRHHPERPTPNVAFLPIHPRVNGS